MSLSTAATASTASRALLLARVMAILVAIGAVTAPPLGNVASAGLLIALAFVPDVRQRLQALWTQPMPRAIAVFALVLLIACAYGDAPWREKLRSLWGWRHLLLLLAALAVFDDTRWRLRFCIALIAVAVAASVISIVLAQLGIATRGPGSNPGDLLRNHVTQAMFFAVAAVMAFVLASAHVGLPAWQRRLAVVAGTMLSVTLAFGQTGRSGYLVLAVAGAVCLLAALRGRGRLIALLSFVALLAALYAASPRVQERIQRGVKEVRQADTAVEYSSMGSRIVIWSQTADLLRARPLLGYGMAGYAPAYKRLVAVNYPSNPSDPSNASNASNAPNPSNDWRAIPTTDPHNQFLFVWVEAGMLGLAALLWLIVSALRQAAPQPYRALGCGFLVAWCVTSLFSSHFQTFSEGHLLAMLLGVFLAQASNAADTAAATSS